MLRVQRRADPSSTPVDTLLLGYDDRKKSRLRVRTERGVEVAIVLERGSGLKDGDLLAADSGEVLAVRAAAEKVSDVSGGDRLALTRAAYHLGNRHVALQVLPEGLRYQHDHVLDELVVGLGLRVVVTQAAFEPEGGAYGHGHGHGHGHEETHERRKFRRLK
jgi:urease accessory protein